MQTYHERWFRREGRPIGSISTKEARERYLAGEPLCLVSRDDAGVALGFVESARGVFVVGFLDAVGRMYLDYSFIEVDGRLFLSQASYFDHDANGGGTQTNYYFRTDGSTTIERVLPGASLTSIESSTTDVARNWALKPDFEDIGALLQSER